MSDSRTLIERLGSAVERLERLAAHQPESVSVSYSSPHGDWLPVAASVAEIRYDGTVKLHMPSPWGGFRLHGPDDDCTVLSVEEWPQEAAWMRHLAEHACNPICEEGARLIPPWHPIIG